MPNEAKSLRPGHSVYLETLRSTMGQALSIVLNIEDTMYMPQTPLVSYTLSMNMSLPLTAV